MLTPTQERRIIIGLLIGLVCLIVTAGYWFIPHQVPASSPRFATGYCWMFAGAGIMFIVSQVQLYWQRQACRQQSRR
jgi:hypothetical protein